MKEADAPVLRPYPHDGAMVASPDGAYYLRDGDGVQIIVVGPMRFTPGEYQIALRDQVTFDLFDIESLEFMRPPHDPVEREIVMRRGFVSMIFRMPQLKEAKAA